MTPPAALECFRKLDAKFDVEWGERININIVILGEEQPFVDFQRKAMENVFDRSWFSRLW
jgi:hypothetical protein